MSNPDEVVDSPTDWVAKHIDDYVSSNGEQGHTWNGLPTLLLTTLGRKSGQWRRTALTYGRDGDDYVIAASKGGAPDHPLWFLNLTEHPRVRLQVGAERFEADARIAPAEERARLWPVMTAVWPGYDEYQARTDREIPVVVLRRV